ncbi:MAG: shikimate dehydrogenase [Usitatibacter sp.]
MDRYAVIGNPVSHSLSPEIHARFATACGEVLEYGKLLAPPGEFAQVAGRFFSEGGRGANVTLPFKVDAFEFADSASERARLAGAANFLALRGTRIEADNTDGAGLVADLTRNHGVALRGKRILLLGAGGAARGVIAPLLALEPAALVVANRTVDSAIQLAQRFRGLGAISGVALSAIATEPFDLVLNATSSSTRGESLDLPAHVLHAQALAYDMAYGPAAKPFLARAAAKGARASDGLGMLVEQAAESYALWRGRRPETASILADLRARFA